jgi:hypothetical protein
MSQAVKPTMSLRNGKQATSCGSRTLRNEFSILQRIHGFKDQEESVDGVPEPIEFEELGKKLRMPALFPFFANFSA